MTDEQDYNFPHLDAVEKTLDSPSPLYYMGLGVMKFGKISMLLSGISGIMEGKNNLSDILVIACMYTTFAIGDSIFSHTYQRGQAARDGLQIARAQTRELGQKVDEQFRALTEKPEDKGER